MTSAAWRRYLHELADEYGCRVVYTSNHVKLVHPDGWTVIASSSPSCRFAEQHVRADVRRRTRQVGASG